MTLLSSASVRGLARPERRARTERPSVRRRRRRREARERAGVEPDPRSVARGMRGGTGR